MTTGFKFEDNSKEVKKELLYVSEEAMTAAALMIEGRAKSLAPVATGELRDKIDYVVKTEKKKVIGQVGSPLDYAMFVEYGTGEFATNGAGRKGGWNYQDSSGEWFFTWGQEAQPFLKPAFMRNRKQIEEVLGGKFKARFKGK